MIRVVSEDALDALNELSRNATVIRSAVAYWTYPAERMDPAFASGLSREQGFLCCDIHSPTSISVLADFHQRGANIFLHLYQLAGRTEVPDSKGIPDNLMHSKVFMFDEKGDQCSIWVGSHNGTFRATRTIPILEQHQQIPATVYKAAAFFVTLSVGDVLKDVIAVEAPPDAPWYDEPLETYLRSRRGVVSKGPAAGADALLIHSEQSGLALGDLPSGKRVKIQHALAPSQMGNKFPLGRLEWERAYTVLSLQSREALPVHRLVRRRIIKRLTDESDSMIKD